MLYRVHCFLVSFSILGVNSADDKLISFLSFPRKKALPCHADREAICIKCQKYISLGEIFKNVTC